jgi:hypothetical protein
MNGFGQSLSADSIVAALKSQVLAKDVIPKSYKVDVLQERLNYDDGKETVEGSEKNSYVVPKGDNVFGSDEQGSESGKQRNGFDFEETYGFLSATCTNLK